MLRPSHWGQQGPVLFSLTVHFHRRKFITSTVSISKESFKEFPTSFPFAWFFQLSPSATLKNHVMDHLKHQMCHFIKARKPPGRAASSLLTLTLLAYVLWLLKKRKIKGAPTPNHICILPPKHIMSVVFMIMYIFIQFIFFFFLFNNRILWMSSIIHFYIYKYFLPY